MWLPREGYEVRVPSTKSRWFSSWRWPTRPTFNILKLHQPLWSSCFRETRKRWVSFYSGHSYSISPAACSLEWSPKPWHQPARRWNSALLESLEWLSILSGCTSGMYSWIQNFPVDSRTVQSFRTVSTNSTWRGYSTSFLGGSFSLHLHLQSKVGEGVFTPLGPKSEVMITLSKHSTASPDVCLPWDNVSVQKNDRMWLETHRTYWLLHISLKTHGHLMALRSHPGCRNKASWMVVLPLLILFMEDE